MAKTASTGSAPHFEKRGLPRKPAPSSQPISSHDQDIVRVQCHPRLYLRQRQLRRRRTVGAEVERLVGAVEMELGAKPRELIVARGFENRRHVHADRQTAAKSAGGDRDVVLRGSVVE